jgi:VWFA-related protein
VGVLCLGLLVPSSAAGGSKKEQKKSKKEQQIQLLQQVPLRWRIWLDEEVYPLITKEQRQAFLSLDTDAQRRSFAERLWIVWGRQSGLGSAFRGIYGERLELARLELGNTVEDRARVLLIHGPPTFHHNPRCDAYFVPMDFWVWPYIEGIGEDVVVLFYQRDLLRGHWRLWTFIDGYQRLKPFGAQTETGFNTGSQFDGPAFRCPNGDVTMRLLASAAQWSRDARYLRGMNHFPEIDSGGGRLESSSHRFMEFSALLDEDAEPLEFSITNNERAARGGLVQVGFAVDVDVDGLGTTPVGDVDVVQLDVVGEITSREEVMVDKFRYLYSVPHAGDKVGLLLDRLVRPGKYQLRLKVEDVHSKHAAIKVYDFDVDPSLAVAEADDKLGDFADEYGTGMLIGTANEVPAEPEEEEEQPTLRLVGPEGDAVSGLVRFNALVRPEVAKVTFFLDNEAVLTKNRPPFDLDLNIGPLPKLTAVMVVGYDASGKEIARDGYSLNVGRERFYVRLKPISASDTEGDRVRVEAELNIPSDGELERLELFWNDEPLATIHEAPYQASVALNAAGQFGYLRALATLSDDSQAEDIQFVNSPQFGTVVKVTAIELPVTVLDNHGDPVIDLTIDDFTVYEDKVEQTISHFSLHRDLPVRMGIVIDTSGSMTTTLPTVQRVVMGFLRDFLRPRDRAFIETFSDRPDILAGFTANFNIIENALLALYADRSTALYDAVIMGLFQFSGVTGRRAMIVLSDGEDTASDNEFSDAFGYAQRMGVTVYTIGINIPTTKITTRWQISKLASVTGGRAFFVSEKSELGSIYDEINRELRTQYLIAFTSKSEHPPDQLRKIKVVVDRKKVKVRTITGYYPVGG